MATRTKICFVVFVVGSFLLPSITMAAPYGSGEYGGGQYNAGASSGGDNNEQQSGGGGGDDIGETAAIVAETSMQVIGGKTGTTKGTVNISVPLNKAFTFQAKIPAADQVQNVYIIIAGKRYVLKRSSNQGLYTVRLPGMKKSIVYTLTADYGFTTKSQKGTLVVAGSTGTSSSLTLSSPIIKSINTSFQAVYHRLPTYLQWKYWADRILKGDKKTIDAVLGAMNWQKLFGKN